MDNTNEHGGGKFEMGGYNQVINNGQEGAIKLINVLYRWMILTLDAKMWPQLIWAFIRSSHHD